MTCSEELRMEVECDLREKLEHHQIGEGGRAGRKSRRRGMGGALEEQMRMRERGERWSGRRRRLRRKGEGVDQVCISPNFLLEKTYKFGS